MKTKDAEDVREEKMVLESGNPKMQTAGERTVTEQAARKALEEMNLLDDFLFASMVAYPEIGERFVRSLLKTIFGREFRHLTVTAQKVFYGADTRLHGARLDVYIEPETEDAEERAAVYDIEPDRKESSADIKALPRRVRFYHGKITARSLNSGTGYDTLKDVVIIMIMPYDPFGLDRMVYTVRNRCVEVPEMEYEDGARTLFLYTKGTAGIPSEEVRQLLHYMEETTYENAVNGELREIHRMVETVKKDPEVMEMHMEMAEEIIRMSQKITEQEEEIIKQEEEIAKRTEEIVKQAEEITKLKEELARIKGIAQVT